MAPMNFSVASTAPAQESTRWPRSRRDHWLAAESGGVAFRSRSNALGCAFDRVIESFRNDLFAGYKTGEGIDPDLLAQFPLAEAAVAALGIVVWPMVEFEADDALATAAFRFQKDPAVSQVVICSRSDRPIRLRDRIVCWDRRRNIVYDEATVLAKYGVAPYSIRIGWPSSGTPPMAFLACPPGVRNPPRPCFRNITDSKTSLPSWKTGRSLCEAPGVCTKTS